MSQPTSRALDLLKVLNRMIDVLNEEIRLLRLMRPGDMQSLQQDKIVLTAAYEAMVRELRADPTLMQGLDPELRDRIFHTSARFQDALTENAQALHAVKEANDRLFRAVVRAIEDKRSEGRSYAASGALAPMSTPVAVQPVSVAVNQSL